MKNKTKKYSTSGSTLGGGYIRMCFYLDILNRISKKGTNIKSTPVIINSMPQSFIVDKKYEKICNLLLKKYEKCLKEKTINYKIRYAFVLWIFMIYSLSSSVSTYADEKNIDEIIEEDFNTFELNAILEKLPDSKSDINKIINDNLNDRQENLIEQEENKVINERVYFNIPNYDITFQDFIYDVAIKYEVPVSIAFTLGDIESGGTWSTNGVLSNGNYGLMQINYSLLSYILENYDYTEEQVLNDPYINMECAIRLLHDGFMPEYNYTIDNFEYENIFGVYNRWVLWKSNEEAVEYVKKCMKALEKYEVSFEIQKNEMNSVVLELTP